MLQSPAGDGNSKIEEAFIEGVSAVAQIYGVNQGEAEDAVEECGGTVKVGGVQTGSP